MNSTMMFNQVLDKFPAVSSLKLWKVKDDFKLIAWENKHIFIINFSEKEFTELITKSVKVPVSACYEEVLSVESVVDVFCFGDKFFIVDCHSWISEIIRETLEDIQWEGDLFEDVPKKILKSELKRKYNVCNDSLLLAASPVSDGISFLVNTGSSVLVKIVNIDTLTELHSITIRNASLNLKPHHNKCLMLYVPNEDIERSYVESWLPEVTLESFHSGLLIVSLPDSNICALFLDELPVSPHFIFSWPFQNVSSHWFCLSDKVTEADRLLRKSNLMLVFDGGSVVTLGQYGGKVNYLPLNSIRSGYASKDYILVSDHSDCYSLNTTNHEEITCLPLKGVLGFCPVPELHHVILASSRHKTLYAINMQVKVKRESFKMPNIEIFDEFLKKTKYLEHLSKQIEQTDDYINTLSYALNSNLIKFNFFIQLVLGFVHSFRIKVSNQNPGIVFRKKIWKFALSLYSNDNCYTFIRDLKNDLKYEDYFVDYISLECKGRNWDFCADTMFVSYLGNTKYRPIVSIGKAFIDISHFIQPETCLKLHQSHTINDLSVEDILENISMRRDACTNGNSKLLNNTICSFQIPINKELSNESVVNRLLKNSKALWRETELNDYREKDKFKVFIGGNLCNIEIRKGFVKISGRNGDCCHSLKVAAVKLLNSNFNMDISSDIQSKLEDVIKSVELLQFNTTDNTETRLNKTISLYQEIKDNLVYQMTGIKMDISTE